MKVMVVEDARAIRERFVAILEGVVGKDNVVEAETVKEAIGRLSEHEPDVVVLDLLLPDGHGLDVLRTVKAVRPSTKVLVMTNDPSDQYRKRALQWGASDFFDKVKDVEKVFGAVLDAVAQSHPDSKL
jgi:DNA-binding NarL/FixJ family response regulator